MNNKLFLARTKSALKSRAEFNNLDLNNYVIFKITDKARENETLKSFANNIDNKEFKYMMVLKDFVVLTTDGGLKVDTNMLSENTYAKDLNTPDEEKPGDKWVKDGVVKSVHDKVSRAKGLTDQERDILLKALKSWGEHHGEEVSSDEEFVDELGESKSQHTGEEDRPSTEEDDNSETRDDEAPVEKSVEGSEEAEVETKSAASDEEGEDSEDEDEDESVTKSARERLSRMSPKSVREDLFTNLKSYGSISEEAPVFQNKRQAQHFTQLYNHKVHGISRAEVGSADRHVRRRYGAKAKFVVEFSD